MARQVAVNDQLEDDLANLARLATSQASEDVRLFIAKLVRKHRLDRPDLASRLDESLKRVSSVSGRSSVLRHSASGYAVTSLALPTDSDSRLPLVREFDDRGDFLTPILPELAMRQLLSIVHERNERDLLASKGMSPTRSAILVGPPGVGKTMSARWIARSLDQPLLVLDLTTVMSSLLGKTGSNMRAVLDYAKSNGSVLLLDEIDAVAKRRSDESDVGELKRLVTVMLQEVDQWPDTSLLLAATNHPDLIDPALWRRFDLTINIGSPNSDAIREALKRFLGADVQDFAQWIELIASAMNGESLADVERRILGMRRTVALGGSTIPEAVSALVAGLSPHQDRNDRQRMAVELAKAGVMSHLEISHLTGVSRDTIRKYAGPSPRQGRGIKV